MFLDFHIYLCIYIYNPHIHYLFDQYSLTAQCVVAYNTEALEIKLTSNANASSEIITYG